MIVNKVASSGVEGRSPMRFLMLAWLITVTVLLSSLWSAYDSYQRNATTAHHMFQVQELRGRIVHLDEVLTNAARMAVTTGDPQWVQRYRQFEGELNAVIQNAIALVPDAGGTDQTDAANVALIEMENTAFELLRQGDLQASREILFGDEYARQKAIYAKGMVVLGRELASSADMALRTQRKRTLIQIISIAAVIPVLVVGWLVVIRLMNRWRNELTQSHQCLVDLNRNLDQKVADRTAALELAMEKAKEANERMSRDLEAAARVQQSLLPDKFVNIEGAEFMWHYRPCHELAGDGLNIFKLDDEHIVMYVIDVSGHGVAPALLSVSVTHHLSQLASGNHNKTGSTGGIFSPAEVAASLNRAFPMESVGGHYFTFLYGVLNVRTRSICFVSAGNPGPIVVHADGSADVHDTPAVPIGMFRDSKYENTVVELAEGDWIYLHSDGLYEERNQKSREEFGRQRMVEQLSAAVSRPFVVSTDGLLEAITKWRGDEELSDDIAILGCAIGS